MSPRHADLPDEIWLEILGYYAADHPITSCQGCWEDVEEFSTLQALRLVCRRLKRLAEPLLCPTIHVQVDSESMERIERLSCNPLIAQGVRAINVNLAFRPTALASDIRRYTAHIQDTLERAVDRPPVPIVTPAHEDGGPSHQASTRASNPPPDHEFWKLEQAWTKHLDPPKVIDGDQMDTEVSPTEQTYQTLLQDCFDGYGHLQEDQDRVLSSGSFVPAVARAISRFTRPISLSFIDRFEGRYCKAYALRDAIGKDHEEFRRRMLEGQSSRELETIGTEAGPLLVRIPTDLIVACDRLGVTIRALSLHSFPQRGASTLLAPLLEVAHPNFNFSWTDLQKACRHVERFSFDLSPMRRAWSVDPNFEELQDRQTISRYLAAMCSSPRLTQLYMNMDCLNVRRWFRDPDKLHDVCDIVGQLQTNSLTHVTLLDVELSSQGLEQVVQRIRAMKSLTLQNIELKNGAYARTVELLREKWIAADLSGVESEMHMFYLSGAEFGPPPVRCLFDDPFDPWPDPERYRTDEKYHPFRLLHRAETYITGKDNGPNPLQGLEAKAGRTT